MNVIKIETGTIFEVITDNFMTSGRHHKIGRPVKILKGEKIEIRYPYKWHFRTEDSEYFHATPETILENCRYVGKILETVRRSNKASLEEILRLELYE